MEHNAKARKAMQHLKIGPRNLDSAFILCDVLKTRELQCQMNNDWNTFKKEKRLQEGRETIQQAEQWCQQHRQKILEKRKSTDIYKKELNNYIKEEQQRKANLARKTAEEEQKYRQDAENELKEQLERERLMLQRKKESMRRNALEAMKMAEERRLSKFIYLFLF